MGIKKRKKIYIQIDKYEIRRKNLNMEKLSLNQLRLVYVTEWTDNCHQRALIVVLRLELDKGLLTEGNDLLLVKVGGIVNEFKTSES